MMMLIDIEDGYAKMPDYATCRRGVYAAPYEMPLFTRRRYS